MAQLMDTTDTGVPHVTLFEGRLRVDGWETATPQIVKFFEERANEGRQPGFSDLLDQLLTAGVAAIRAGGVAVNVDYIEKEFDRLRARLKEDLEAAGAAIKQVTDAAFAEEGGTFLRALKQYLGEGGRLDDLFDPKRKDSALGRIQTLFSEHFDGDRSKLARLLDLTNSNSPLHTWKETIDKRFEELRKLIEGYHTEAERRLASDQARAEEREKSALKGLAYQDLVFQAVNHIAKVFGDSAEPTADLPGVGSSKAGDTVVTINPRDTGGAPVRIVFEAKDRSIGAKPISRELEAARTNRAAAVAIAVYSREDHMPSGASPFREDGPAQYLCLYDKDCPDERLALALAYRIARFCALQGLQEKPAEVDAAAIRQDLQDARKLLSTFASMKTQLTQLQSSVEKGVDGVSSNLDGLKTKLSQILDRIDSRITASRRSE